MFSRRPRSSTTAIVIAIIRWESLIDSRPFHTFAVFGPMPGTEYFKEDWIHYRANIPMSIPQMSLLQLALILGTFGVFVVYWRIGERHRRHLPPGPKKLPLIGNLFSMPSGAEWETFTKWGKEYSSCLIPCTIFISYVAQTPTLFTSTL
jgi:hypothetical protein